MAVRNDFTAGEVLAAADLNDTFASKLDLAGGKVLQIVRATDSTLRTTTSTSYVDVTGMSVTITPQKSDSAVLILAVILASTETTGTTTPRVAAVQITDSSDNSISGAEEKFFGFSFNTNLTESYAFDNMTIIGYSTPATTSAVTYKLRFKATNAGSTARISNQSSTGQMYAIEVSA